MRGRSLCYWSPVCAPGLEADHRKAVRLLGRGEVRADQQDVVVGVPGRHDLSPGRAERAAAVDVLEPGRLVGGAVGARPDAVGGAGAATVDVTAEDDRARGRATREQRLEFDALRVVPADLDGRA